MISSNVNTDTVSSDIKPRDVLFPLLSDFSVGYSISKVQENLKRRTGNSCSIFRTVILENIHFQRKLRLILSRLGREVIWKSVGDTWDHL